MTLDLNHIIVIFQGCVGSGAALTYQQPGDNGSPSDTGEVMLLLAVQPALS